MAQETVDALFVDPFAVINTVEFITFTLVGTTEAIREEFDMFGVTVVGLATVFAGYQDHQ